MLVTSKKSAIHNCCHTVIHTIPRFLMLILLIDLEKQCILRITLQPSLGDSQLLWISCAQHLPYVMLGALHLVPHDDKLKSCLQTGFYLSPTSKKLETNERNEVSRRHAFRSRPGFIYVNFQLKKIKNQWIMNTFEGSP